MLFASCYANLHFKLTNLTAHTSLYQKVGLRVTQDVFLLHPTLNTLSGKMMELQKEATNAPTMDPIESKEGGQEWFPASAGQVRCVCSSYA